MILPNAQIRVRESDLGAWVVSRMDPGMRRQPSREDDWPLDVRVRAIRTYKGVRRTSYTVRWDVAGRTGRRFDS